MIVIIVFSNCYNQATIESLHADKLYTRGICIPSFLEFSIAVVAMNCFHAACMELSLSSRLYTITCIVENMMKNEKGMGELLKHVAHENRSDDLVKQLRIVGLVFVH